MVADETGEDFHEEASGTAGDVGKAQLINLGGFFSGDAAADGLPDDVADNVIRSVINAARFPDFGLGLDDGSFVAGDDDIAEESLVNAAKDGNGNGTEKVIGVLRNEVLNDSGKRGIVDDQRGIFAAVGILFVDDAVVAGIEAAGDFQEIAPRATALAEIGEGDIALNAAILEEPEKDEPVQNALCERGEALAVEVMVGALERLGKFLAPEFHLGEEFLIDGPCAASEKIILLDAPGELGKRGGGFVERTGGDVFACKQAPDFGKLLGFAVVGVGVGTVLAEDVSRGVVFVGSRTGVEDEELLEISEDDKRRGGVPAIENGLVARVVVANIDTRFFRLYEESGQVRAGAAEGVVGAARGAGDVFPLFGDDILFIDGAVRGIAHIPPERLEKRGDELIARGILLVARSHDLRPASVEVAA